MPSEQEETGLNKVAKNLEVNQKTESVRFKKVRVWNWTIISILLITLIVLLIFGLAFFKFAIILRD